MVERRAISPARAVLGPFSIKLSSQFLLIGILPFAVALLVGAIAWNAGEQRDLAMHRERLARNMNVRVFELDRLTDEYLANPNDQVRQQWRKTHRAVGLLLDEIGALEGTDASLVAAAREAHARIMELLVTAPDSESLDLLLSRRVAEQMSGATQELVRIVARLSMTNDAVRDRLVRWSWDLMFGTVACLAVVLAVLSYVMSRGITKRQLAEETLSARNRELAESEERFRILVESSPNALLMVDTNGAIRFVNIEAERLFGYSRSELIGEKIEMLVPQNSREHHSKWSAAFSAHPEARPMGAGRELCAIRKDGAEVPVEIALTPVEMADGTAILATVTDVSERKRAERGLRESEERLTAAMRVAGLGIFEHDHISDWIHFSPRMREMYGFSLAEPLTIAAIVAKLPPADRERVADAIRRAHDPAGDGSYEIEHRIIDRDGRIRWIEVKSRTSFAERDGALRPLRTVGAAMDVTNVKSVQEEIRKLNMELEQRVRERTSALKEANAELEAFTYTVSHDLRAPLRHMSGFAQMLQVHAGASLDEKGRRYLSIVVESADRMGNLMDQLLSFSRLGRAALNKRPVPLNGLVRAVIEELLHAIEGSKIQWRIAELPEVNADAELLRLVFLNLLSNAIKFSRKRDEPVIEVGSSSSNSEWILFVRDNGAGFESEYGDKLFGVFQRLHRQDEFEGTGIGLANVRRIVTRHGGRTWAEGAVNKGATFYISLPK